MNTLNMDRWQLIELKNEANQLDAILNGCSLEFKVLVKNMYDKLGITETYRLPPKLMKQIRQLAVLQQR